MKQDAEIQKVVLVVEDDELIRAAIMEVLEEEDYQAVGAANGADALTFLQSAPKMPGLILLDLMMPVMDGWHFRVEQMRNPVFEKIPVVVVTADGNAQLKAEKINAKGWVKKPIEIETLLKVVRENCT